MVVLPVVARELRVAARGRGIYRVRFWPLLIMLGLLLSFFRASAVSWQNPSEQGLQMMTVLAIPAFVFAILAGPFATADCISSEKRQGTLGLLFLTDLKGWDVIFGKMAASSLNAIYGLLAIMPVLSVPVMLGGVSFARFLDLGVVLLSTMAFSLAAGVFVSTFSRNERKAMFYTLLILAAATALPFVLTAWYSSAIRRISSFVIWKGFLFSLAFGLGQTLSLMPPHPAVSYWLSIAWQWAVTVALIAVASFRVAHSWDQAEAKRKPRAVHQSRSQKSRPGRRRAWLERNPFAWLALQVEEASPGRVWFFVLTIFGFWGVAVVKYGTSFLTDPEMVTYTSLLLDITLKIWIAAEAARRFVEDRAANTFEFLLSTPLSARQIVRGQWLALLRQFAGPMALVLVWEGLMEVRWPTDNSWWHDRGLMDYWPRALRFVTDSAALASLGMWLGLSCKSRIRALFGSLALVLFLPWAAAQIITAIFLPASWSGFSWMTTQRVQWQIFAYLFPALLVDVPLILWAAPALTRHFRRLATATPA